MTEAKDSQLQVEETLNVYFVTISDGLIRQSPLLQKELLSFLREKNQKPVLMLNLENVKLASAAFLTALMRLHAELKKQNRHLKVYNYQGNLKSLFTSTLLHKHLDLYDTEDEAFEALQRLAL